MKKIVLVIFLITPLALFGQNRVLLDPGIEGVVNQRISGNLEEGSIITVSLFTRRVDGQDYAVVIHNNKQEIVPLNRLDRITLNPRNPEEFWIAKAIEEGVYSNFVTNGYQYGLRKEIDEDVLDYMQYLEGNNLFYYDSYLDNYIYTLIHKIYPSPIKDGRQNSLNIRILKDHNPNAAIYPNGTMILTTGLLSTLNSEEELIGVLAHEIAHFILDHSIINLNEAVRRQKRAEFWAGVATGLAAVADVYLATQNQYYSPGLITMGTSVIAFSIADQINERVGLKYSREQEYTADRVAAEIMSFIGADPTALASALKKIRDHAILTGNYHALSDEGSHPLLTARISTIGQPGDFNCIDFDRRISFLNTFNSIQLFNNRHFKASSELLSRNLAAGVATEDDYILMAALNMFMFNNEEKNNEALQYLETAETLNIYPSINLYKQKALVYIRLGKTEKAKDNLETYFEKIEDEINRLQDILNPNHWAAVTRYLNNEHEWTAKMIGKVHLL